MSEFKEGDVVYLKSGGPAMTITGVSDNQNSNCEWFDKHHTFQSRTFINLALTKNNPTQKAKISA